MYKISVFTKCITQLMTLYAKDLGDSPSTRTRTVDLLKSPHRNGCFCSFEGSYMKYFCKCKCFILNIIHV